MASAARRRIAAPAAAAPLPALPDEILESIFLLLDDPADLARAASACTCFRRVATARPFLRRFGSLHGPPPLLGLLFGGPDGFRAADPPHRSAKDARALARAADFTFSFLPNHQQARRRRRRWRAAAAFDDLMVCDPLHRRCVRVPSVPNELVASIPPRDRNFVTPFLAPAAAAEDDNEPPAFSVIRTCQLGNNKVVAFFFGSGSGSWHAATPYMSLSTLPTGCIGFQRYYVRGCFHWMISSTSELVLDTREMKFSTISLPPIDGLPHRSIFERGEGRLGLIAFGDGGWPFRRICEIWQQNSGVVGTQDWQLYKTIPLPGYSDGMDIQGEDDSYFLLRPIQASDYIELLRPRQYFVLDLKTLLFEGIFSIDVGYRARFGHLYVSFPPPLAPPSI
ncbi:unnamed protein product [Urochloa decumbens]|uniref:F-box domain-containing protein n=1 Tax=Urochloa decumbens TaxID=240449 RepID=A0ABC8VW46_9POAL